MLHQKYYKEYGLAIQGLTRHHKIDPLEFNREVDDALPLDRILRPDARLRRFLLDLDRSRVKPWLLTNAYVTHAKRVVRLLGVEDCFEGLTYCDYAAERLVCKPNEEMWEKAEREAGAESVDKCFFVGRHPFFFFPMYYWSRADGCSDFGVIDDSHLNCRHAQARGWTAVHFVEPDLPVPEAPASKYMIRDLEELRDLFPQFFKSRNQQQAETQPS